MKTEIIYIWTNEKDVIFDLHLNTEYEFVFEKNLLNLDFTKNPYFIKDFFGEKVNSIIAMVGENGSGKTTNLKKVINVLENSDKILSDYLVVLKIGKEVCLYTNIEGNILVPKEIIRKNGSFKKAIEDCKLLFYSNVFDTNNIGKNSKRVINLSTNSLLEKYSEQEKNVLHYRQRENKKHIYFTVNKKEELEINNYVKIPDKIEVINNRMLLKYFEGNDIVSKKVKEKISKSSVIKGEGKFKNPMLVDIYTNIFAYVIDQFFGWLYKYIDILSGSSRGLYDSEISKEIKGAVRAELELESSSYIDSEEKITDESMEEVIDVVEHTIKEVLSYDMHYYDNGLYTEIEQRLISDLNLVPNLNPRLIGNLLSVLKKSLDGVKEKLYQNKENIFEKPIHIDKVERITNDIKVDSTNTKRDIEKLLLKANTKGDLLSEISLRIKAIVENNTEMKDIYAESEFLEDISFDDEDDIFHRMFDNDYDDFTENIVYKDELITKVSRYSIYEEKEKEKNYVDFLLNNEFNYDTPKDTLNSKEDIKRIDQNTKEIFSEISVLDDIMEIFEYQLDKTKGALNFVEEFLKSTEIVGDKVLVTTNSVFLKKYISTFENNKFNILLDFEWRNLSSGEYSFLSFMSRLYDISSNLDKGEQDLFLIIDEGELYFHPQWQKKYINLLINALERIIPDGRFQILLTTHSPFLLSDLPNYNVRMLKKGDEIIYKTSLLDNHRTFGANIQELFMNTFFLKGGLTGEFSKNKINSAIKEVLEYTEEIHKKKWYYEKLFNLIGEPIVRRQALALLNEKERNYKLTHEGYEKRENKLDIDIEINNLQKRIETLNRMKVNQNKKDSY